MAAQSNAAKPPGRYSSANIIPTGLSKEEKSIYDTLLNTYKQREATSEKAPNIVVITDLAKDYDDLAAMVVLKELHRLGLVNLFGFVANLTPATKRAMYGRGALDSLGLKDIPIAIGTNGIGSPPPGQTSPSDAAKEHDYEFTASFYTQIAENPPAMRRGNEFLKRVCEDAQHSGKKITFLLLSSLQDVSEFSSANPELFKAVVKNVILQGGYTAKPLKPSDKAVNNRFHWPAAEYFHSLLAKEEIQSAVYTKHAAFMAPLDTTLLKKMEATGHVLGVYLKQVHIQQEKVYYYNAVEHGEFWTQDEYLKKRTCWFDHNKPDDVKPSHDLKKDEIDKWLTVVIVYDALAALGAAGQDVMDALDIKVESSEIHEIVGIAGPVKDSHIPGIEVEKMKAALKALLVGSLLAANQKLTT